MIIRGTTPTLKYTFSVITTADLTDAYLTVKKGGAVVVTKDLTAATVEQKALSWTLTQEETLSVSGSAEIMLNWKAQDGTRGASMPTGVKFIPNHIEEAI